MSLEDYFRGLSDPTRLRIINLLLHEELCGCHIQRLLGITQPLVSRHLVYLKRSGLVLDRRGGFRVFYRLAEENALRGLFTFLQRAFRDQEPFESDTANLRAVLIDEGLPGRECKQQATGSRIVLRNQAHSRKSPVTSQRHSGF